MQQLEAKLLAQLAEAIDELFLQTIELVAARRQLADVELVFQPDPLEEGRFIQRGRGVGIVLQQLRFADAIPGQVETRVERRLVGFPRLAHKAPGVFRDAEFSHQLIAGDHFLHHLEAHLMQLGGDFLQFFHLREGQLVISLFAPVGLAVHGVEVETVLGRFLAPVRALGNTDSFHVS